MSSNLKDYFINIQLFSQRMMFVWLLLRSCLLQNAGLFSYFLTSYAYFITNTQKKTDERCISGSLAIRNCEKVFWKFKFHHFLEDSESAGLNKVKMISLVGTSGNLLLHRNSPILFSLFNSHWRGKRQEDNVIMSVLFHPRFMSLFFFLCHSSFILKISFIIRGLRKLSSKTTRIHGPHLG